MAIAISEVWIPTGNYSYRDPGGVRYAAFHATEGILRVRDLGYFFQGNVSASSHHGADNYENCDAGGVFGAYVDEADSAWTQCNANGWCVSLEQCAPSGASYGFSRDTWLNNYGRLLRNSARWLAYVSGKWDIPITGISGADAAAGRGRGVVQHADFGQTGCGHGDCGPGWPEDVVFGWAKEILGTGGAVPPAVEQPRYVEEEFGMGNVMPDGLQVNYPLTGRDEAVAVNLGADVGGTPEGWTTYRVAAHRAGTDQWRVWKEVRLTRDNPRAALDFEDADDVDLVSVKWTGGALVAVTPRFKLRA